jgi:1,4-alpha-glucan branching enzyme
LSRPRQDGALAIVLHSHMPYVEGFGTWPFGEEWLWEAVACVYLPLLDVLDGTPVTLGLTPVLCDQFDAMRGDAGERYLRFLRDVRAPIHAEDAAGLGDAGEPRLAA